MQAITLIPPDFPPAGCQEGPGGTAGKRLVHFPQKGRSVYGDRSTHHSSGLHGEVVTFTSQYADMILIAVDFHFI